MSKITYIKYYLITGSHEWGLYSIEKRVSSILEMHKTCFEFEEMGLKVKHTIQMESN